MDFGFSPEQRCLIGVSGGRDSVMLLHLLIAAGFRDLVVCHLDHALRPESAEDARFVAELAEKHDVEVVVTREDIGERAAGARLSVETAARQARYEFFARTGAERNCPRLFLAHHADDQVETLLFNLFRGTAMSGLAGMRALRPQTVNGFTLEISRPLLGTWREEIDAYLAQHQLAFREDASNADPQHTRNRMRHHLIPEIEKTMGREVRHALWRTAEILRAEDELLAAMTDADALSAEPDASAIRTQPLALQRRLLHAWLKNQGVPDVGFREIEAVRSLLTSRTAKTNLPGGWHARRRARKLFLEPPRAL